MEGCRRENGRQRLSWGAAETCSGNKGYGRRKRGNVSVYEEKSGRKVAETGAAVKEGKAEAEWWPIDTRPVNDKKELRYIFEITGNRCKKIKSGEI